MGKTLAVVFWSLAAAGGVAYYVQSQSAPVPITTAPAPIAAKPAEQPPEEAPIAAPVPLKPRTMAAFGLGLAGPTITLIVTPPAPNPPYTVTLTQQAGGMYAGINPSTAPSIYPDNTIGYPPTTPAIRNNLPIIVAFKWADPWRTDLWRVAFQRSGDNMADYGGGWLRESSSSPLSATPFTANGISSVTAGWSLRLAN